MENWNSERRYIKSALLFAQIILVCLIFKYLRLRNSLKSGKCSNPRISGWSQDSTTAIISYPEEALLPTIEGGDFDTGALKTLIDNN